MSQFSLVTGFFREREKIYFTHIPVLWLLSSRNTRLYDSMSSVCGWHSNEMPISSKKTLLPVFLFPGKVHVPRDRNSCKSFVLTLSVAWEICCISLNQNPDQKLELAELIQCIFYHNFMWQLYFIAIKGWIIWEEFELP